MALGPVDEVAHDQEVARKPHLHDGVHLELQALRVAWHLRLALIRIRIETLHPLLQPLLRSEAEIGLDRHAVGRRIVRQARLAQFQHQVAAPGDLGRVGKRRRHVGEQLLHLRRRLEILLAREPAHAPLVAQDLAFGDADAGFMRLVIVFPRELNRMGRDGGQLQTRRQLHGRSHVRFIVGTPGTLQFQVEPVRKDRRQRQCQLAGPLLVALHQGLAHRAGLGPRQRDQAFAELAQPFDLAHALRFHHILRPGAGQQLAQVEVALPALHQHHHARQRGCVLGQALHEDLGADDRLDAGTARFLVELDRAEQVVEVGDRQGGLAVGRRRLDDLIDAIGAVDDGKLGVQAQVNEHGCIVGNARSLTGTRIPHACHFVAALPPSGAFALGADRRAQESLS